MNDLQQILRQLPSVTKLLVHPTLLPHVGSLGERRATELIRRHVDDTRAQILHGKVAEFDGVAFHRALEDRLVEAGAQTFRRVINATGIVLHTNLGRAPMAEAAARAAYDAARSYLNLEMSLQTGKRSSRQDPVRAGLCEITGTEAATVVNNCAAATVIVLRALAAGKEVIVSRGQLIEIGGSFRIPDIMTVSGATLREVGTTNITRLADYEDAITPNTGMILRVHPSNYRIRGFTEQPEIAELAVLGNKHGIPVVDDVGSGATAAAIECIPNGDEPRIDVGIRAGADVVMFSCDKLLGGPQAGCIAGKKRFIDKIERDPLMRTFRLDKMALAALEATLHIHTRSAAVSDDIPVLRMLKLTQSQLRTRCTAMAEQLRQSGLFERCEVQDDVAYAGGGSLPDERLPTSVIALKPKCCTLNDYATRLRLGEPAIVARVTDDAFQIDLRAVFPADEEILVLRLLNLASAASGVARDAS